MDPIENAPPADQNGETQQQPTETPNVFDQISEATGKNYSDPDAVIKALTAKDEHIAKLEDEGKQTRELVDTLSTKVEESINAQKVLEELSNRPENTDATPAQPVGKEEIKNVFNELFNSRSIETVQEQNLNAVNAKLAEVYGDKALEALKSKATELGLTPERVKELAKESPKSAMTLLGLSGQAKAADTPRAPAGGGQLLPTSTSNPVADFKAEMKAKGLTPTSPKYILEMNKRKLFD